MKKSVWLWLGLSLALNAVIVAALVSRSPASPSAASSSADGAAESPVRVAAVPAVSRPPGVPGSAAASTVASAASAKSLWELLASRDPATFAANLRAAGFQVGMVRGAIYALLRDLQTSARTKAVDSITSTTYWKNDVPPEASAAYSKEISRLWLERDRIMRSIFPEEQQAFVYRMQARFGPISAATMEKISQIEQDYSEMQTQARSQSRSSGMQMPWSGEEVALLGKEMLKDISALLSPAELENYQMRGSSLGSTLQRQLDGFEPTEKEYRDIYALRKAADAASRANGPYNALTIEGRKAQADLEANLKTALGDTRYAEYQRGLDNNYQTALSITRTLDLPVSKAAEVYDLQRDARQRENSVRAAQGLAPSDRQAQLAAIAAETKQKLATILTPAGAEQFNSRQRNVFFLGN